MIILTRNTLDWDQPAFLSPPLITTTNTALRSITIASSQKFYRTPLLDYIKSTEIEEVILKIEIPCQSQMDQWKCLDKKLYQILTEKPQRWPFTFGISITEQSSRFCERVVRSIFPLCTAHGVMKCLEDTRGMYVQWLESSEHEGEVLCYSSEHRDRYEKIMQRCIWSSSPLRTYRFLQKVVSTTPYLR